MLRSWRFYAELLPMPSRQLEKVYEPQAVEARWGQYWLDQGFFKAHATATGSPFTIVIPPPNVTGSLHIGHALNNTLQDVLIRWRRMQGRKALWIPGTDHAGIATQNVVERQLHEEGISREHLGREAFIERVWKWKQQSGNTIIGQLKHLGASCDWDRLRFTMDEGLSKAVREVFVRLHEDGLIYRGERLINWCPRCLTALSDIEVEHEQIKGKLYHIKYPLANDPNTYLTIATTRPETMLGDTAVAVHPEDPRYNNLIGESIRLPLTSRTIPIVGDSILVDREFGTGAVKITPAHDFNDFDAGERHQLPRLSVLNYRGHLAAEDLEKARVEPGLRAQLANLPVVKARPIVVEALQAQELIPSVDEHHMALGKCYRCKTVVEPFLSPQWFVKIQPLADPAIEAVESGKIRIIPEGWANNYLGWMRGIKDWCISRQIWWGHRIPAWYCTTCYPLAQQVDQGAGSSVIPPEAVPVVNRTTPLTCPTCHHSEFIQDPDVLDTWFSSALWPFSTLGWPEDTPDFKAFYPTSTLITGLDILFFWVARMIMMGLKFTGQPPFRDVYIHALVRDAEGQKMSKSKGNVIDPLTKMSEYGTDALRFTLISMASPGRDIKLSEERIEGYRNFTNKIWNAARFILMNAAGKTEALPFSERPFIDRWILARLNEVVESINTSLEHYRFDQAASHLYHFIWHEYCDWYVELIKPALQSGDTPEGRSTRHTLLESFEIVQRLLHPLMPFLTEEIWQALPHEGNSIVIQTYPTSNTEWIDPSAQEAFHTIEKMVTVTRTGRALLEYGPSERLRLYATAKDSEEVSILRELKPHLEHLGRGDIEVTEHDNWPTDHVLRLVAEGLTIGLHMKGDIDLQKALNRILKQTATKQKEASRLQGRLASPEFAAKAATDVFQESRDRLDTLTAELSLLASSEQQLKTMIS